MGDDIKGETNVGTTERPVTVISHCYGYGGIDAGLQRVFGSRIVTIAACEIEAFALQNGIAKSEASLLDGSVPFHTNIKSFPFSKFRGLVDIYTAGFPCQPWSGAGARKADKDPRHLFPFIKSGLEQMQPEWVFLENVDGIVSSKLAGDGWNDPKGTPVLLHVLRELERVGYAPEAGVFSASEVGASHQRKRVFILARRRAGWKYNRLPVLPVADGQCWGCPVWTDEAEWEKMRREMVGILEGSRSHGRKVADPDNDGCGGKPQQGITDKTGAFGVAGTSQVRSSGQGDANMADPGTVRCVRGTIPDGNQERSVQELAQQQGQGTMVRGETEGRSGINGLADSDSGEQGERCDSDSEPEDLGEISEGGDSENQEDEGSDLAGGNQNDAGSDESGAYQCVSQDGTKCNLRNLWPSRPGEQQTLWEPPRVTGKTGTNTAHLDEMSATAKGTMANADGNNTGDGGLHGAGDGQGRKPITGGAPRVQQRRKANVHRPEQASGDNGKVICGSCGFQNAAKWKRTKCLVCGKELVNADSIRQQNGQSVGRNVDESRISGRTDTDNSPAITDSSGNGREKMANPDNTGPSCSGTECEGKRSHDATGNDTGKTESGTWGSIMQGPTDDDVGDTQRECGLQGSGERQEHRGTRETDGSASPSPESVRQDGQGQSETEPSLGGDIDGITLGMVLSEYTGLSYQELEEIYHWMCAGASRVDELRLLGNGVVPPCAERAFRTLYARLDRDEQD